MSSKLPVICRYTTREYLALKVSPPYAIVGVIGKDELKKLVKAIKCPELMEYLADVELPACFLVTTNSVKNGCMPLED